jgi:Amino acid synthesis
MTLYVNKPTATAMCDLVSRKWYAFSEETTATELGKEADGENLWKHAVAAVVNNPYAGRYSDTLDDLIASSVALGETLAERLLKLCGGGHIAGYGKGAVVGVDGEYEHGNALVTAAFADPIRKRIGGGKAWIPSTGKRGGPGVTIDVPLAHKEALFVRSHYDTFSMTFADAPGPREIVVIFAVSTRGRLNSRVGGLAVSEVEGLDGLR